MNDTLAKLYACLQFMRTSRPVVEGARWYLIGPGGAKTAGPYYAAELAYRIYTGTISPSDTVLDTKTGSKFVVSQSSILSEWLDRGSDRERRLTRGLLLCVRRFAEDKKLPFPAPLPAWSDDLLTPEERRAFQVLKLDPSCSPKDAKRRHRELAVMHHPDHGGSVERMQEINWAYDVVQAVSGF